MKALLLILNFILVSCVTSKPELLYYKVKVSPGDTLDSLSSRFDTTSSQIKRDNNVSTSSDLKVGRFVIIRPGQRRLQQDRKRTATVKKPKKSRFWNRLFSTKNKKTESDGLLFGGSDDSQLHWPVGGVITSHYGMRRGRLHEGIDIGRNRGASVRAAASGVVSYAGWIRGYGRVVDVKHDTLKTRYAHLKDFSVRKGDRIARGALIGHVGSSGKTTGAHLHFEVLKRGRPYNPLPFLDQRRIVSSR